MKSRLFAGSSLLIAFLAGVSSARSAEVPERGSAAVALPAAVLELLGRALHPIVAATPEELGRLRAAYAGGAGHEVVSAVVKAADRRIERPVEFPVRGGQHNSWYQCNACQIGLKTMDATHPRCPRCATVYSGPPYDDVLFSGVHRRNLDDMAGAAWAYAVTGREKYAAFSRAVLLGYAQRYRAYLYHDSQLRTGATASRSGGHLFEQTLNEASDLAGTIAPAYDLIYDSAALTADDHEAIREQLLRPMLENLAKHKAGKSNWQTWHNAAMLWGGAVLRNATWVRRAVEDPENGFGRQMQVSVSDEGMWYENSWGYHFYTLSALVKTAEAARRLGFDLWRDPVLKKMFYLPVAYAMPDGSLPRLGDDSGTRLERSGRLFESAYQAYGDAALLALLPAEPTWDSVMAGRVTSEGPRLVPAQESGLFPGAGHAILRTRGEPGLVAALTFGPYGGSHGHFDKLSFVFFGFKRELGVDPGRARSQAYRLPIHQHWYKATIGHNAVVVDGVSQKPATGKLESYAANASWAAVVARCDDAYPGVANRRVLVLAPSYLLVYDELDSSQEHRFDWLYHSRGSAAVGDFADASEPAGEEQPGWKYIERVRCGMTDDAVRVRFVDEGVTTHLTLAAAGGSEVRTGDGVGGSVLERVPLAMVTRRGSWARFAATLEPVRTGQEPMVTSVSMEENAALTRITVQCAGHRDVFVVDARGMLSVSSDETAVLLTK